MAREGIGETPGVGEAPGIGVGLGTEVGLESGIAEGEKFREEVGVGVSRSCWYAIRYTPTTVSTMSTKMISGAKFTEPRTSDPRPAEQDFITKYYRDFTEEPSNYQLIRGYRTFTLHETFPFNFLPIQLTVGSEDFENHSLRTFFIKVF